MPLPEWRSRAAGQEPDARGRPEFAAEFLRRNSQYRTDHASMVRRIAAGTVSEAAARAALARRWGLSFCLGSIRPCRRCSLARGSCPYYGCS